MTITRAALPHPDGVVCLGDVGLEQALARRGRLRLPAGAAYLLLGDETGRRRLANHYERHAAVAAEAGLGFVLETPTRRANADWGRALGHDAYALAAVNREAVRLAEAVRSRHQPAASPFVIAGSVGPRHDGYDAATAMSASEAKRYHAAQVATFADSRADLVAASGMACAAEAAGVALAAAAEGMACSVGFTLETNGRLPSGESLADAVARVDDRSGGHPLHYEVSCAHASHVAAALETGAGWTARIGGLRLNAVAHSHAELAVAGHLDGGDPAAFAADCAALVERLPAVTVVGGCCGCDHRHMQALARMLEARRRAA